MRIRARHAIGVDAVALLGPLWLGDIPLLRAADPLIRFQELMAGANGDSRVQFITFVVDGNRAKRWAGEVRRGLGVRVDEKVPRSVHFDWEHDPVVVVRWIDTTKASISFWEGDRGDHVALIRPLSETSS